MQTTDNSNENLVDITELTEEEIAEIAGGTIGPSRLRKTPTCPECGSSRFTKLLEPVKGNKVKIHFACRDCGYHKIIGPVAAGSH